MTTVKYKGETLTELTADGTKTLKTAGKYCEGDIEVTNKESGATIAKNTEVVYLADTDSDMSAFFSAKSHRNKDLTIKQDTTGRITNMNQCFRYHDKNKTIDLQIDTSKVSNFSSLFDLQGLAATTMGMNVIGNPVDFSAATNTSYMFRGWNQGTLDTTHILFKPDTLKISADFKGAWLDDESLESLLGALKTVTTQMSLSLEPRNRDSLSTETLAELARKNWEVN